MKAGFADQCFATRHSLVLAPRVTLSQMADSVLADLNRHMAAQVDQLGNLVGGNEAAAEAHRRRYAELLAVMDGKRRLQARGAFG